MTLQETANDIVKALEADGYPWPVVVDDWNRMGKDPWSYGTYIICPADRDRRSEAIIRIYKALKGMLRKSEWAVGIVDPDEVEPSFWERHRNPLAEYVPKVVKA